VGEEIGKPEITAPSEFFPRILLVKPGVECRYYQYGLIREDT